MYPIPSLLDLYNKIKVNIFSNTSGKLEPEKDPFVKAISVSDAQAQRSLYEYVNDCVSQSFVQYCTDETLLKLNAFDKTNNEIKIKDAEFASGRITIVTTSATTIDSGSEFVTSDGQVYESVATVTSSTQQFLITNLQRVDGYAIATVSDNELGNGMTLTISGANETDFNGSQEIEILDANTFRYVNAGSDETATGTIIASFLGARVNVTCVTAGSDGNKTYTDTVEDSSGNTEIDSCYITYDGITGGADKETAAEFKVRLQNYLKYPQNKGNKFQFDSWTTENTDATFAQYYSYEDNIYIYLVGVVSKMNDDFSFTDFSTDELTAIKSSFISSNQYGLEVIKDNISIINPSFISINISISDLTPNTLDMQNAIKLVAKEYLAKLDIKQRLSSGLSELDADKIKTIILSQTRDSKGNAPSIGTLVVSNVSSLDADYKKPILGTITF